jgi:CRISPR-associated protein Cmr6
MPVAAVPTYLGSDFRNASPGMRFGLLLPIWTARQDQEAEVRERARARSREGREVEEMLRRDGMDAAIRSLVAAGRLPGLWKKNDSGARDAWNRMKVLTPADRARMQAIGGRQTALAAGVGDGRMLRLTAEAIAPFTTGLGNEHPLENGFAFLNPYGLPYLPGSGVKGVVRQAARELASGMWGETHGWRDGRCYPLVRDGKPVLDRTEQPIALSMADVLFGRETAEGETEHVRGALSFWDVIPQIAGDALMVEVMTPHQSHYYQIDRENVPRPPHFQTPHDSGQPRPISFLTVPPGSRFVFHVVCDVARLRSLTEHRSEGAPDLLADGDTRWKALLRVAFEHAFAWLGFGAKTAVGYGALSHVEEPAPRAGSESEPAPAAPPPADPRTAATEQQIRALRPQDKGRVDGVAQAIGRCPAEDRPRLWAALRQRLAEFGWHPEIRRLAERYPELAGGA